MEHQNEDDKSYFIRPANIDTDLEDLAAS